MYSDQQEKRFNTQSWNHWIIMPRFRMVFVSITENEPDQIKRVAEGLGEEFGLKPVDGE